MWKILQTIHNNQWDMVCLDSIHWNTWNDRSETNFFLAYLVIKYHITTGYCVCCLNY